MPTLEEGPYSSQGKPRLMLFFCPVGPHTYECTGDPALGHEELDVVKCSNHANSEEIA
jgi:hypothetical protein